MISQDTDNSQEIAAISHSNCTYRQTKTTYKNQPFYRCHTCFTGERKAVCSSCVERHHSGT